MIKKVFLALFAIGVIGVISVSLIGCSLLQQAAARLDPGFLTSGEVATISGSVKYTSSSGTTDINLAAVLVSGEAITIEASKVAVYIGKSGTATSEWTGVDITIPGADTDKPMDIAFILDNTGSMSGAITGSKDSINAFAATLEAAGIDAQFGLVTFGDSPKHPTPKGLITDEGSPSYTDASNTREVKALGTAAALKTTLETVEADGGGDLPENPLDAIMYAYNNFSWRSGAQKVFIVITDVDAHQVTDTIGKLSTGGNRCTTSAEAVISSLSGKAVIHSVSPTYLTSLESGLLDVRRLADGLGESRETALSNTGGKWITFESTGFDLTTLGISNIISKSYTLRFTYTFDAGTWYIHVLVDTNSDGTYDSDVVFTLTVSASGAVSVSSDAPRKPEAASVSTMPNTSRKPYVAPPNN